MPSTSLLISEEQIQNRIRELADQINEDYTSEILDVLCILKGALFFSADLIRRLTVPVRIHFIQLGSYGSSTESSGTVSFHFSSSSELKDRHVLIVEDILDTGITFEFLLEHLKVLNPASLKSCVLLNKRSRRKIDVKPDYTGFEIQDQFVVGYGLDFNELYRNLPYVAVLNL